MQKVGIKFIIAGADFNPPTNWQEIQLINNYDSQDGGATISIDTFRFSGDAAARIKQEVDAGNIFSGLPFSITLTSASNFYIFNGYLDLSTYVENAPNDISVSVGGLDFLDNLDKRLSSITYLLLKEAGFITNSDYTSVDVVIEKEFIGSDIALLAITTYLMAKETYSAARVVQTRIAQLISLDPAAPAKVAALLVLDIIYLGLMVIATIKLFREVFTAIYPQKKTEKGITLFTALSKAFSYLGYTFSSPINDLNWLYLPSKSDESASQDGIPNPEDTGYIAAEMVNICKDMFNAALFVDSSNKEIKLLTLNDPFWRQQSNYVMKDHLDEVIQYNTDKVVQTRLVSYEIDSTDFHTFEHYKGTSYEITTEPITPPTSPEYKTIKGFDQIRIPLVLCVRKDELNILEKALAAVGKIIDTLTNAFGGNSNFSSSVKNRVGMLKKGQKYHAKPKIVILDNGKIPANYRDLQSAKYLYDTYINQRSLVANNFIQQKEIHPNRKRWMDFDNFMRANKNKYFTTANGENGEFIKMAWSLDLDYCICDYYIDKVYTTNLKETAIEID